MENNTQHWKTRVVGIQAKDIFELAEMITEINMENFVIATQPIKVNQGYDALVFIKFPPIDINKELGIKKYNNQSDINRDIKSKKISEGETIKLDERERPTEKQLRFLKDHKFKVDNNLTKSEATKKIKEYLDRINKNNQIRNERSYEDY